MGEILYYQVNPMKKWLKIVLIIILFCVFLFSTWQVIDILMLHRPSSFILPLRAIRSSKASGRLLTSLSRALGW